MTGQTITFDGHRLNDLFFVGDVETQMPTFEPTLSDRPRGSVWRSRRVGDGSVTIPLIVKPNSGRRVREAVAELMSWLDVDGVRELALSADEGLRRKVVPSGIMIEDSEWGDVLSVTFEQVDPYLIGEERLVTIPSGTTGPVAFHVGGTAPTRAMVSCQAAMTNYSMSYLWQLTDESGKSTAVRLPSVAQTPVVIDSEARVATVAGEATTITLESDWLELSPGEHSLRLSAGVTAEQVEIRWNERWHA